LSAAAGNGLDTSIKYLRVAAGNGPGSTAEYLRRTTSVAACFGLGITAKYLRRNLRQRSRYHDQVPATHIERRQAASFVLAIELSHIL
jgi:hypothetical protein